MCVYCVENVSTALTYIALDALEILMTCINSVDINSMYGWKALILSFPKLFGIENQLNIKNIKRRLWAEMCVCVLYPMYGHT